MASRSTAPGDERGLGDASRRTYLAAERTLLAWWRSGLAALAVALAIGRLVPVLIGAPRAPFVALGVGFGALAVTFIVYGASRQRHVERAIAEGEGFRQLDTTVIVAITVLMVVLVTASIVLIVFER